MRQRCGDKQSQKRGDSALLRTKGHDVHSLVPQNWRRTTADPAHVLTVIYCDIQTVLHTEITRCPGTTAGVAVLCHSAATGRLPHCGHRPSPQTPVAPCPRV